MAADMSASASCGDSARSALDPDALRRGVLDNLICLQARPLAIATPHDWYMALAYSVRDRMLARWAATIQTYAARELRVACYLSAEFLIGPQLGNNLVNLGIEAEANVRRISRSDRARHDVGVGGHADAPEHQRRPQVGAARVHDVVGLERHDETLRVVDGRDLAAELPAPL